MDMRLQKAGDVGCKCSLCAAGEAEGQWQQYFSTRPPTPDSGWVILAHHQKRLPTLGAHSFLPPLTSRTRKGQEK